MDDNANRKKKGSSGWLGKMFLVICIFLFALLLVCGAGFGSGVAMQKSAGDSVITYDSIDEALNSLGYEVNIPEYLLQQEDVTAKVISGKMLQLNNNNFVLKASMFVDVDADPLGLYGASEVDNKHELDGNSTSISYFRYRSGYEDYLESKLINWVENGVTYGLMISEDISEADTMDMLGIQDVEG